ncbi:MAG: hypothetical protein U0X92_06710 [Anaerolineales bacterium]
MSPSQLFPRYCSWWISIIVTFCSTNSDIGFKVILYLVVSSVILLIFRENPKEYGFSFGDWKAGLIITLIGILVMAPVIYFLGNDNICRSITSHT